MSPLGPSIGPVSASPSGPNNLTLGRRKKQALLVRIMRKEKEQRFELGANERKQHPSGWISKTKAQERF